jgi:hypothetical protein
MLTFIFEPTTHFVLFPSALIWAVDGTVCPAEYALYLCCCLRMQIIWHAALSSSHHAMRVCHHSFSIARSRPQRALHTQNSGFAAATLRRHISTFRGYQILFSIRNPYINRFTNHILPFMLVFRKWITTMAVHFARKLDNSLWHSCTVKYQFKRIFFLKKWADQCVDTFPRFVAIRFYFLSETLI